VFTSLRSRLLVTYLVVTGLVLALVGVSLLFLLLRNPQAQRQVYQRLEVLAEIIVERDARLLDTTSLERIQTTLVRLGLPETRVLIVEDGAEIVVDSRPALPLPPAELLSADGAVSGTARSEFRDAAGRRWLVVSQPLSAGRTLLLAAPALTLRSLLSVATDLIVPLLEAALVALAASVALAWLVSRWVAAPLRRMATAARGVAAGDPQSHLPVNGPSEVQALATAFNDMVGRVQTSSQAQRDLVANVSHDLRTPLTSIQGFAQAILDGAASDSPSQQHAAQVIYDESDRLRRLVESLLDLARLDAGQMVFSMGIVDMAAILRGVMERLSLKANEKGVRFEDHLLEMPAILGDGDRLAQVFTNLLDNAIQHTPSGGAVTVRGKVEAGWDVVEVEDTGPGIPPDELSRIFERFYRLDKARPGGEGRGVGLGLAISREIIQAHGGRLSAQSTVGRGSCFAVRLPLARSGDTAPARRKS
jgi:two-component system OmpR family sensor kinase